MENKDPIKKQQSGSNFECTCTEFKIPLCSTQSLPNGEGILSLLRSTPALHAGGFPAGVMIKWLREEPGPSGR